MDHVYIVIATEGSWDDRCEWIAGVYLTREEAETEVRIARSITPKQRADWQDLYDSQPWDADKLSVIGVPIGKRGKWSAF